MKSSFPTQPLHWFVLAGMCSVLTGCQLPTYYEPGGYSSSFNRRQSMPTVQAPVVEYRIESESASEVQ